MLGVYGGTFDPVHFGHLRTAMEVKETVELDEILFVLCGKPPHRTVSSVSSMHRLSMLQAAVEGVPGFKVDARELEREGYSYSFDTLASLRQEKEDRTLCLILGMDAFQGFASWYRWQEVFNLAHLLVMFRPGAELTFAEPLNVLVKDRRVSSVAELRRAPCGLISFQQVTQLDISSTRIRELIRQGNSPRYLLPDAVWAMIRENKLYQFCS